MFKFSTRRIIVILSLGVIFWIIFFKTTTEVQNSKKLQTQINLNLTRIALQDFYSKYTRWPSDINELAIPGFELQKLLKGGFIKCFAPADGGKGHPIIIFSMSEKGLSAVMDITGYSEKIDMENLNFEGYRLIPVE